MAKKFKNFRKNNSWDDEWGNVNEDRLREKKRGQNLKNKRKTKENEKFQNFKEFNKNG